MREGTPTRSGLHFELAQESVSGFDDGLNQAAKAAYSVLAFDWSGGRYRRKERDTVLTKIGSLI